jgi:ABC-2 type transport system ATP-binding protein
MTVLTRAGATVAPAGRDTLAVTGLASEQVVARLSESGVGFSEISVHRATLEEAYLELSWDAVEFRAQPSRPVQPAKEAAR